MLSREVTDDGAELTLQIVNFLQCQSQSPRSPARWVFVPSTVPWPGGRGWTFAQAAEYLATVTKPIVIGALNHPGAIAVWRPTALDEAERNYVTRLVANQQDGLAEMTAHFNAGDADRVVFEGWGVRVDLPVSTLRRWVGQNALTWGWRLGPPTDASHCARLLVFQGERRWSPGDERRVPPGRSG